MAGLKFVGNSTFQTGTLNTSYTAGGTSLVLNSGHGSRFPTEGDFWVRVESEIFKVTARSTDTLTVVGGQDGTTNVSHSSGASVEFVISASALTQLKYDIPYNYIYPPQTGWSFVNQNSATVVYLADGTLAMTVIQVNGTGGTLHVRSTPATPWTLIAAFQQQSWPVNFFNTGVLMRESATGKFISIGFHNNVSTPLRVAKWSNPLTISSNSDFNFTCRVPKWLKLTDNGTTITFGYSCEGEDYYTLLSEARGTFFTTGPDQIGIVHNKNNSGSTNDFSYLRSWNVT